MQSKANHKFKMNLHKRHRSEALLKTISKGKRILQPKTILSPIISMSPGIVQKNPQICAPITVRCCRESLLYDVPLKLRTKEEKFDELKIQKDEEANNLIRSRIDLQYTMAGIPKSTMTLSKYALNKDCEEVEDLHIWQYKNVGQNSLDPNFKKLILNPIEKNSKMSSEILLRDPIFKRSILIKDPGKIAEGFNRTTAGSSKNKEDQLEQGTDKGELENYEETKSKPMRSSQSAPRLGQLDSHPKMINSLISTRMLSEIDYQQLNNPKELNLLHKRNVANEVQMEYKKQKLLEILETYIKRQEKLRKENVNIAFIIEKQNLKISVCNEQIDLLTKTIQELTEGQFTKMEETNRIRNAKEKIRDVIKSK